MEVIQRHEPLGRPPGKKKRARPGRADVGADPADVVDQTNVTADVVDQADVPADQMDVVDRTDVADVPEDQQPAE